MSKLIISIDADGTIWEQAFPAIGNLKPNAKKIINQLYNEGHKIIINSCRSDTYLEDIRQFLDTHGIRYHSLCEPLPEIKNKYGLSNTHKIYAHIYIDDRNLGGIPDDWDCIYNIIQNTIDKDLIIWD